MNFQELLEQGIIKPFRSSKKQIKARLELSKRDIRTAQLIIAEDQDWAFSIAYNAVLQSARALMFAHGFRPGRKGTVLFLIEFNYDHKK